MNAIYIGVLSGTSMDAVDAAAFCFERQYSPMARHSAAMPAELRFLIRKMQTQASSVSLASLAELDQKIGRLFSESVLALLDKHQEISRKDVGAVGVLGQTVVHEPYGKPAFTWQAGDANIVAKQTGLPTVADFRRADMALGGQGAPLASCFHRLVFERRGQRTAVANVGGIANLSLLPGDGSVSGFDCGPGNCLLDVWVQKHRRTAYDRDGRWASRSRPNRELLAQLMTHPFLRMKAPKSACTRDFSLAWLESRLEKCPPLPAEEVQASLTAFTAECISRPLRAWKDETENGEISAVLCGGGARNHALVHAVRERSAARVRLSDDYGIPAEWVEAAACAWLAKRRLEVRPGSRPGTTGVRAPAVLGAVYR